MAGLRRNYLPFHVHHAIARFHDSEYRLLNLFTRREYLRRLTVSLVTTDWQLLAFALMSSHLHLVLRAGQMPPRLIFQPAHGGFGRWLNGQQRRSGQLFAGRYRLWIVRRPTAELIAYVHNNPVRAGVVTCAAESLWTSHRDYLSPSSAPPWLSVADGLELSGFADPSSFDDYVRAAENCPRDLRWSGERDGTAIAAVHQAAGAASDVGEPVISDTAIYPSLLRPRAFAEIAADFSPEQILDAVAMVLRISRRAFCGRVKTRPAVRARWLALQVWQSMRGPQVEMSAALGMSSSAASCLLRSDARHHRQSDIELVWHALVRSYPQEI